MAPWNPLEGIDALHREIKKAFEDFGLRTEPGSRSSFLPGRAARRYPLVNLREDKDSLYVDALAPGVPSAQGRESETQADQRSGELTHRTSISSKGARRMAEKTVASPTQREITAAREGTRSQARYMTPPVDIYETREELVVMADLPGVSQTGLDVRVEDSILTIQGRSDRPDSADIIYREYELSNFFRQFELSEEVDQAKIGAELKHGVLTLHLPKAEKAKPRQINVNVG